jgi:hypothetical protein
MPWSWFLCVWSVGLKRCEAFGTVNSQKSREPLELQSDDLAT